MIALRHPSARDGARLYCLVQSCPPLDPNSRYCNLLQAHHFSDTSVVAERDGALCGFVTGYKLPRRPEVLFVWQVAVDVSARGEGLAGRMLDWLVRASPEVGYLETTVTPGNTASTRTFERFAERFSAPIRQSLLFCRDMHFEGLHDDEMLLRIGPLRSGEEHFDATELRQRSDHYNV